MFAGRTLTAGEDVGSLSADRTAVERVYYEHRLGSKPPFEQILPPGAIEQLVQQDFLKEAVLSKTYAVEITPAQVALEVNRIDTTTRAPEVLNELKRVLGNDPARFGRAVAKPNIVQRELRERFENDDQLHAPLRGAAERVRARLLAAKAEGASFERLLALMKQDHKGQVSETVWQLGARPAESPCKESPDLVEMQKRFGPSAQIISSPDHEAARKLYIDELQPELRNVLGIQLRQAGDVSAVIEMPGGFLLYLAREKTSETLGVAVLSIPKRSYDQWLAEQSEGVK